jgi:hypothetical protein
VLLVPTFCGAYVNVELDSSTGSIPVPLSGTVCGLFAALSVMTRDPVSKPTVCGTNVTDIRHIPPAFTVRQLLVWLNGPLTVTLETLSLLVPEFRRVIRLAGLVLKMGCGGKVRLDGLSVTAGCARVEDGARRRRTSVTTPKPSR